MSLIEIGPVDAAECRLIIEDFDWHLMFSDTDIFGYSMQTAHSQELLIAAPVTTDVALLLRRKRHGK